MQPFTTLTAVAAAMPLANIDTDQVIPARFMRQPRTPDAGYDRFLFHDMRRRPDGSDDPAFALNQPRNRGARIIAARRNFGCGSSREAAVYALVDSGIRCVVAPSFGDIFSSNAVNNGLLAARVAEADIEALLDTLAPGGVEIDVDLHACSVTAGGRVYPFQIDPVWRLRLLNGWDEIDMTRRFRSEIAAWVEADRGRRPWAQVLEAGEGMGIAPSFSPDI
jgi:3-isopropylmalate/(R)-2-methylmalate dehydratase small subunit